MIHIHVLSSIRVQLISWYKGFRASKNTWELVNLGVLQFSLINKLHIFQCLDDIFSVEFQKSFEIPQNILSINRKIQFYTTLKFDKHSDFRDFPYICTPLKVHDELTYECHLRECYVWRKWIRYDYRKAALGWWLMILQLPGLYVDFYIGMCRARMNSLYNFTLFLVFWLVHAVSWGPPPRKSIDYLLKAVSGWQHVSTLVYPPYSLVDSIKLSCVIGL